MQNHYLAFMKEIPQCSWPPFSRVILPPLVRGVEWWFQARLFLEQIQFAFALFLSALAVYGWCSTFQEVSGPQCRKGRGCLAGLIRRQLVLRGTWNSWPGLPGLARMPGLIGRVLQSVAYYLARCLTQRRLVGTGCTETGGGVREWGARSWTNRSSSWQTPQRTLGLRLTLERGLSI